MVMELVFLGMNSAGEKTLDWLEKREDAEVKAVLTEKEELSKIKELEPELVVSSGFEYKVPKQLIEIPEKGIVNLHPSLLPYNRGSHPYIWPIIEDSMPGVSVHYMNEEIDEGPIIDRKKVEKKPCDTAKSLHDRLMQEQFDLFIDVWPDVKKGVKADEQDPQKGNTHYSSELDEVCEIDLEEKVVAGDFIDRLRGLTYPPEKLAYFHKNGNKYFVRLEILEDV